MNKMKAHSDLLDLLHQTYKQKNQDYGDSFGKQFGEYGEISSAIRLEDKLNRFKSLINSKAAVKDESKEDTLLDLANYAVMTVIELKKRSEKDTEVAGDSIGVALDKTKEMVRCR
ncbi:nucleotide modification associated domain-containing protein [Halobacillus sp. BBL2006]|uniref:nucleotide modification associated domain-containing protein n=1 Tax=Halobacillus sp. BBL2006 TaxID=1543706 RepID=UPI0009DDC48D|nr:nucleotide modification associated domain-containing protein [Halobacillus sp. BBL2006]